MPNQGPPVLDRCDEENPDFGWAECACPDPNGKEYEHGACPKHPALATLTAAERLAQLNGILRSAA